MLLRITIAFSVILKMKCLAFIIYLQVHPKEIVILWSYEGKSLAIYFNNIAYLKHIEILHH